MTALNAATTIQKNPAAAAGLQPVDIFEEFATDAALENGGSWVTRGASRFLIARSQNDNFNQRITKVLEENEQALKAETPESKELSQKLMNQVLAETILVGWENVTYKGEAVEYSVAKATEMLAHRDFRVWVREQSDNRTYYKAKLEAEAVKN